MARHAALTGGMIRLDGRVWLVVIFIFFAEFLEVVCFQLPLQILSFGDASR